MINNIEIQYHFSYSSLRSCVFSRADIFESFLRSFFVSPFALVSSIAPFCYALNRESTAVVFRRAIVCDSFGGLPLPNFTERWPSARFWNSSMPSGCRPPPMVSRRLMCLLLPVRLITWRVFLLLGYSLLLSARLALLSSATASRVALRMSALPPFAEASSLLDGFASKSVSDPALSTSAVIFA